MKTSTIWLSALAVALIVGVTIITTKINCDAHKLEQLKAQNEAGRYQLYGPPFLLVDTKDGLVWKMESSNGNKPGYVLVPVPILIE